MQEMNKSGDVSFIPINRTLKNFPEKRRAFQVRCKAISLAAAALFLLSFAALAGAQDVSDRANPSGFVAPEYGTHSYVQPDTVYVPETSIARPEDAGKFAHTDYVLANPDREAVPLSAPKPNPAFENPGSLACIYGLIKPYSGCTPQGGAGKHVVFNKKTPAGWGAIALVDAFDNPNAATDYATFSKQYHLPTTGFTVAYANSGNTGGAASCGGTPPSNAGWALEESLDIEYAHAMAPTAQIILVEACSASLADLVAAENYATTLVTAA
ncbi:MAG TPA: hypothetical protein VEF07_10625, partial [Candidatus Binataceae bacterium]|nr:hypothetical protein [Candidatus Binataceae bacterium]